MVRIDDIRVTNLYNSVVRISDIRVTNRQFIRLNSFTGKWFGTKCPKPRAVFENFIQCARSIREDESFAGDSLMNVIEQ